MKALDSLKLRGPLAVFAVAFVCFLLLNGRALVDSALNRSNDPIAYQDRIVSIHGVADVDLPVRLGFIAAGLYILWLLHRRDRRLVRFFTVYGALFLTFELIVRPLLGEFMNEGNVLLYWSSSTLHGGLLVLGFVSLRRWAHEPSSVAVPAPIESVLGRRVAAGAWFWVGTIMVAWPFVVELFIDATLLIAGLLVPTAVTEGYGLALTIQAVSVAIGLLVLMRLAFHMRISRMLVLFPICCGVLYVVHFFMGFLHFTF